MTCDFKYHWCSRCCENFPIRGDMDDRLEMSGDVFYCPRGHAIQITRETVVGNLRSIRRTADYRSKEITGLLKRAESYRGVQTRQRNRILRGACPYCGENAFPYDLIGHIKAKHGPKKGKK